MAHLSSFTAFSYISRYSEEFASIVFSIIIFDFASDVFLTSIILTLFFPWLVEVANIPLKLSSYLLHHLEMPICCTKAFEARPETAEKMAGVFKDTLFNQK